MSERNTVVVIMEQVHIVLIKQEGQLQREVVSEMNITLIFNCSIFLAKFWVKQ